MAAPKATGAASPAAKMQEAIDAAMHAAVHRAFDVLLVSMHGGNESTRSVAIQTFTANVQAARAAHAAATSVIKDLLRT